MRVGTPVEQVELADGCAAEAIDHECDVITSPEREITGNRLDEFVDDVVSRLELASAPSWLAMDSDADLDLVRSEVEQW